ncbi:transmembrane protein 62-like isoform X2 [Brevipalpus obovatus]|uniref:transmembrane protein 62-like isoform X2 n=1 Tax=Brevipalpus obovatus TaxID=246614 RepID=UPI003D9E98A4
MLTTTFFLIVVVIVACFASFIINIIAIEEDARVKNVIPPKEDDMIIGNGSDHLMWFIQISDIHLSVYFDRGRQTDFIIFCNEVVDAIKPSVVIASGDLTDSRTKEPLGCDQFKEEWSWYWEALNSSGVLHKTTWLDIRGNHDTFNVYSWDSPNNYFKNYSAIGPTNQKHYVHMLKKGNDLYKFVAIDGTPEPSPIRPFNFVGILREKDFDTIRALVHNTPQANTSIWFGHYPTSSIFYEKTHLHDIIDGPYLCGHFHTLNGLIHEMYATQRSGFLEAEVADWKDERMFRVAAVDHGLFALKDVALNRWPIILITNPKSAVLMMPKYEPYHRISQSTHVRAMIFSPHKIVKVEFRIDDGDWKEMIQSHSVPSLYTYPWIADKYGEGLHKIAVRSEDDKNNEREVSHEFSLDGTRAGFSFGSRLVLRSQVRNIFQALFLFTCFLATFPLIVMRVVHSYEKGEVIRRRAKLSFMYKIHLKLYLISTINQFFYPLLLMPFYAIIGPWFVGELLTNHWGVYFAWGAYIDGSWAPAALTYLLGTVEIWLFHIPIIFLLGHIVDCRYSTLCNLKEETTWLKKLTKPRHIFFAFLISCYIIISQAFWLNYGLTSVILGFRRFWSLIIYLFLWSLTFKLDMNAFPACVKDKN